MIKQWKHKATAIREVQAKAKHVSFEGESRRQMPGTIQVNETHYRRMRKEYEAMRSALVNLITCHDRPHGFDDGHWYDAAVKDARAAIELTDRDL